MSTTEVAEQLRLNPDCQQGKHAICDGHAWDEANDQRGDCPCACHTPTGLPWFAESFRVTGETPAGFFCANVGNYEGATNTPEGLPWRAHSAGPGDNTLYEWFATAGEAQAAVEQHVRERGAL